MRLLVPPGQYGDDTRRSARGQNGADDRKCPSSETRHADGAHDSSSQGTRLTPTQLREQRLAPPRIFGEQAWQPPSDSEIADISRKYTESGRKHLPANSHVVLGYLNKKTKQYAAYCKHCDKWFDWPPQDTTNFGSPCSCEAGSRSQHHQPPRIRSGPAPRIRSRSPIPRIRSRSPAPRIQQKPTAKDTQQKPSPKDMQQKPSAEDTQQKLSPKDTQQKPTAIGTQQKPAEDTQQKPSERRQTAAAEKQQRRQ
jgi:hypothetical protein